MFREIPRGKDQEVLELRDAESEHVMWVWADCAGEIRNIWGGRPNTIIPGSWGRFSFVCMSLIRSWTSSRHTPWCHYLHPESHARPHWLMGLRNKGNHGISWVRPTCRRREGNHFVFLCLYPFIPFSGCCVVTPCWGWAESDILFGSWQHHLERKMKRDGDNTETHAFTHTSRWPVHPTLFIGQFRAGNLGPS